MTAAAAISIPGEWDHLSFRLGEDFVQSYAERTPPWGFPIGGGNSLGEITWFTKYARTKADGTKERWHEGCRRVVEGTYSILKDHCQTHRTPWNAAKAQRAAEDMYDRLWSMKWTPPGRGLWMMGTPFIFEEGSAALQNCYASEVEVITDEGAKKIGDLVGTSPTILTTGGKWVAAPVRSFGTQALKKVTMTRAQGETKVVYATAGHRWYVRDRRQANRSKGWVGVTTDELRPGVHQLQDVYGQGVLGITPSPFGVAHGFAYGDGRASQGKRNSNSVTLFGEKDKVLTPYFEMCPSRWNKAACGGTEYGALPNFFKEKPSINENKSYLYGWISGYFAADGCVGEDGSVTITSHNRDAMAFVRDVGYVLGIGTYSIREGRKVSNLDGKEYDYYSVTFMRDTLTEDFFLVDEHRRRWIDNPSGRRLRWRVASVEDTDRVEEVYCATVDGYDKFALTDNILAGNCAFLSTEKLGLRNPTLPFVRLMEMSMLGIGVGFDTRGAGKLDVHKPSETTTTYRIPDSREGWCESVNLLLRSYLLPGQARVDFIYDDIRPAGEPIKRFGGLAAGPGPLRRLHEEIRRILDRAEGQSLSSTLIVDIGNMIGKCVVAGNVRRSAEIALGFPDDKAFLQLKDWEINPERNGMDGWGHLSNNSVMATVGMDLDHLAQQVVNKGEPGVLYIDLMRSHGRLADPPNNKDWRAAGCNPCAEQTLEDNECCTLVETYPTNCEDFEDYRRTLKVAYLYAKAVTLLPTHWPESNEVMSRNRRIGASGTGLAMFAERNGWTMLRDWMDRGYEEVISRDHQYSEWLGVRESIKTTSIKPSGTVSLLAGVTPGVHWPVAGERYFRRVRYSKMDPIVPVLEVAGYHVEPSEADPEADVVVTFPTTGPPVRSEREVSVWEKVNLAALAQKHWADNMVSATFTFSPEEEKEIPAILRAMDGQMKSMSFLPMGEAPAYPQMPYEKVPDEEFEKLLAGIKPLDMDALYATDREADGEKFCNNDVCII